jgi:hypothetical protein
MPGIPVKKDGSTGRTDGVDLTSDRFPRVGYYVAGRGFFLRARDQAGGSILFGHRINGPHHIEVGLTIWEKGSIRVNRLMRTLISRYGVVKVHGLPTHVLANCPPGDFQRDRFDSQLL